VLVPELENHAVALAEPGADWQRFGSRGSGVGEFDRPAAAAFAGDTLLVLDTGNCRVVALDGTDGSGWTSYGRRGRPAPADPAEGAFADPRGLAVDSAGRIWISDPGARRLVRIDAIDGSGWAQIDVPAAPAPALPYGLGALGDGVVVLDVGNRRIVVVDGAGAATAVELAAGEWAAPVFATGAAGEVVAADVAANELRLLQPDGADGFAVAAVLRGSPPDLVQPLFDSIGGVAA
jgi:hypothetical protein